MRLTQTMLDLLAKASVVAEGPTMKIDSSKGPSAQKSGGNLKAGHVKTGGMEPRGPSRSLPELMLGKWAGVYSLGDVRRCERECAEMLAVALRNPGPVQGLREVGSVPWKREIAQEAEKAQTGGDIKRLGQKHSISRATVYRYLAQYGERKADAA